MKRFDLWKLSLLNVFSSPVRSVLTVLGFAIGIAAVLAVLTLGAAGRKQVQSEMKRLGIDRVWLTGKADSSLPCGTGKWLEEAMGIEANELIYVPSVIRTLNGHAAEKMIIGCESEYLTDARLGEGRMLWPAEWRHSAQKILIGEQLAAEMNIRAGEFVTVAYDLYEVCGILRAGEGVSTVPLEESIVMPLEQLSRMTGNRISEIQLNVPEYGSVKNIQKRAELLLERHGSAADAVTMEVQMEAASSVINTFVSVLGWVSLVCILVGGVGIMNILLVGVRERKREIGVMKSMGTMPAQICILFLLEALIYAAIGGILGILLGMALIETAGKSIELFARASLNDCLAVFSGALCVGLFFGVAPAFRASLLTCVDALRQE